MTEPARYLATIPSPTSGVWHIGPISVPAFAAFVLLGVVAAVAIGEVRLRRRGAARWLAIDLAIWAVPFGLVGARISSVITSWSHYFGPGGHPLDVFKIWVGGLGIWGAVALGGVGAWIGCRRRGVPLTYVADALAVAVPVAQAIGRLGDWFANDLYGGPTSLPWALTIYDFDPKTGSATFDVFGRPIVNEDGPFHPTFLYELLWCLAVALVVYLADRKWNLRDGRAFALYAMGYAAGRFWIETLRDDATGDLLNLPANSWIALAVFMAALSYFMRPWVTHPSSLATPESGFATAHLPQPRHNDEPDAEIAAPVAGSGSPSPAAEPAATPTVTSPWTRTGPLGADDESTIPWSPRPAEHPAAEAPTIVLPAGRPITVLMTDPGPPAAAAATAAAATAEATTAEATTDVNAVDSSAPAVGTGRLTPADRLGRWLRHLRPGHSEVSGRHRHGVGALAVADAPGGAATADGTDAGKEPLGGKPLRFRRLSWVGMTAIAALAAVNVIVGMVAVGARNDVDRVNQQQRSAEGDLRLATARLLAAQANVVVATEPQLAVRLGIAALAVQPDLEEARAAVVKATMATGIRATLYGGTKGVFTVAISPDGRTLVTGGQDATAVVWDLSQSDRPRRLGNPLTGHADRINDVAFSPDGLTLALASYDGTVSLWDLADRAKPSRVGTLTHNGRVASVAFSPDGHMVATGSNDATVILWNITDRSNPAQIGSPLASNGGAVQDLAFSPDGTTLGIANAGATASLWDVTDPAHPRRQSALSGHGTTVTSLAFSPDGKTLATGSIDDTAVLWDVSDAAHARRLSTITHGANVYGVVFSPDGRFLATAGGDKTAVIWDVADRGHPQKTGTLTGHTDEVYGVAFAPDGHTLATASADSTTLLWDVTDMVSPTDHKPTSVPLTGHTDAVSTAAFSPDGHVLATAGAERTVIFWDVTDPAKPVLVGSPLQTGNTGAINALAFSPNGHVLATASEDHTVILWDVTDPSQPHRLGQLAGHGDSVNAVAFSPDGRTIATAGRDAAVILWDLSDPKAPQPLSNPLRDHDRSVWSLVFTPDGRTLASAGADQTVVLWDVADRARPHQLARFGRAPSLQTADPPVVGHTDEIRAVAVSPSGGRTLATGGFDGTTILWDITNRALPTSIGSPLGHHAGPVWSVAFSPDGLTLATASQDHTVVLWDLSDPARPVELTQPLAGHSDGVRAAAFSPDGQMLATAGLDKTVVLWNLAQVNPRRSHALQQACTYAGRALTAEEWARYVGGSLPYVDSCA